MKDPRLVAITTGPSTHLDHLGILSSILNIPLIVTEPELLELHQKYYPTGSIHYIPLWELSLDILCQHFEVILESGKFWNMEMSSMMELIYKKQMSFVFCPHGNSDKGWQSISHAKQKIALYYGRHMYDLLHRTQASQHIEKQIRTGNYRYSFYLEHKSFYQTIIDCEITPSLFTEKKTILYAPTWHDEENPSSFFASTKNIIKQLSGPFNVIVKLHPLLEQFHPAQTYEVLSHFSQRRGVLFLKDFPPIYPLLDLCSLYLGDYSSIGYDFLAFDKPIFFLVQQKDKSPLHRCGIAVPSEKIETIYEFIAEHMQRCDTAYREERRRVYGYAFGRKKKAAAIKSEIMRHLSGKAR